MKKFYILDFWIQLFTFIIIGGLVLISNTYKVTFEINPIYFYFGVGGVQLFSFIIHLFIDYKKHILFKIYGCIIIPIWLSLIGFLFGNINSISEIFLIIALLGLYISPLLAVVYIYYCFKISKINIKTFKN